MGLREFFLWQLEHEAATTRAVIERVPEGRNHWKPHTGCMELGQLAVLVASLPGWVGLIVNGRVLNLPDQAKERLRTTPAQLSHLLATGLATSRKALEKTTEDHLVGMVRFCRDGQVIREGPRYAMIADSALTQQAHLRGQLTVYLGMLEAEASSLRTAGGNPCPPRISTVYSVVLPELRTDQGGLCGPTHPSGRHLPGESLLPPQPYSP